MVEVELSTPLSALMRELGLEPDRHLATPDLPTIELPDGLSASAVLEPMQLRLDLAGPQRGLAAAFRAERGLHEVRGKAGDGELVAPRAYTFGSHRFGSGASSDTTVGLQLFDWHLLPEPPPSLWFGELIGLRGAPPWTNVRVADELGISHLFLPQHDGHDYGVVWARPDDDLYLLVVDTKGAGAPVRSDLERDLACLGLLHGCRLGVPYLRAANDPTALLGSAFGRLDDGPSFAELPVPDVYRCWALPLFRRLAPRLRTGPAVVRLALEYYLDSFRVEPDQAYLTLTVVLEGIAIEVLRERGAEIGVLGSGERFVRVRDSASWESFVGELMATPEAEAWGAMLDGRAEAIRGHAIVDDSSGLDLRESLLSALRLEGVSRLGELPASRRVQAAFAAVGLSLDNRMKAEQKRWNTARHKAIATRESGASLAEQLRVLRAMVLGLLLRWAGYRGPILGHRTTNGRVAVAERAWWGRWDDTEDAAEATVRYVCSGSSSRAGDARRAEEPA